MASTLDRLIDQVCENRIWRSIFRSGTGESNLHRSLFVQQNLFLQLFSVNARHRTREFNWVVGVVLLLMTLLLSYTGYLLPWDQLAFWAVTVGSNIASAVPVMGGKMRFLMLGGTAVNANALLRF